MLPSPEQGSPDATPRVLVIGCGALARELVAIVDQAALENVTISCLPATLHDRPGGIPAAVRGKIRAGRASGYRHIFVAYADCGTGGLLDRVLAEEGVERLAGAHCYEVFAGAADFARLMDDEPGTFFLTDFLVRNADRLIVRGLGLDRHPELLSVYFAHYRRVVYLAQTSDPVLVAAARLLAARLGLAFEVREAGFGELRPALVAATDRATAAERATVAGAA